VSGAVALWRIATETRSFRADDLSGAGAAGFPGRWNNAGEYVVYAAPTLALAVLETTAHLDDRGLPLNRFVVRIEVPAAVWKARETIDAATLNPAWCAIPGGRASADRGSAWYRGGSTALLQVPSVIVPEECAVLINARHADAASLAATTVRAFDYNRLFRG